MSYESNSVDWCCAWSLKQMIRDYPEYPLSKFGFFIKCVFRNNKKYALFATTWELIWLIIHSLWPRASTQTVPTGGILWNLFRISRCQHFSRRHITARSPFGELKKNVNKYVYLPLRRDLQTLYGKLNIPQGYIPKNRQSFVSGIVQHRLQSFFFLWTSLMLPDGLCI